jgi:hypothetical protein
MTTTKPIDDGSPKVSGALASGQPAACDERETVCCRMEPAHTTPYDALHPSGLLLRLLV